MRRASLLVLAALVATSSFSAPPEASTHRGEYFYNFENAYFTAEGNKECWSLKGDMSKAQLPSLDNGPPWGTSTVVLKGTLGPRGSFGNLGVCTHVFSVLEIVEVSNMRRRE
jgi:hypothetical protein